MKRKAERLALAAGGLITLCSLCPVPELTAAAFQQDGSGFIQNAVIEKKDADAQWSDDGRRYQGTTKTDPLNMRAEPGQSAPIITTLPKGTVITVIQTRNGWGKVQYGSLTGYCAMEWLTLVPEPAPAADPVPATDPVPAAKNDPKANEATIYRYLTETLGLSTACACGIIGNIHVETGGTFDPEAHNENDTGGTQGYGICQWNSGEAAGYRMEELQSFSPQWKTLECQLEFIRHDLLNNTYLLSFHLYDDLKKIGNTEEDAVAASDLWARRYEGCAQWTYEARREKSRFYYAEHSGKAVQWKNTDQIYVVATNSGTLNMRDSASLFGSILTTIPKGEEVTVRSISDDGKWGKVEYKGRTGFCAMEYLKEKSPAPADANAVIRGDVNGNAEIGPDDAQLTLEAYTDRIAGNGMHLTEKQIKAADIDGDGQVSVEDAQLILRYYTEKYVSAKDITWEQLIRK